MPLETRAAARDGDGGLGYTALLAAADRGALAAMGVLLELGCDVNAQDACGNTSLHLACRNADVEAAALLHSRSLELVHGLEIRKNAARAAALADAAEKGLSGVSVERYVANAVRVADVSCVYSVRSHRGVL